MGPDAITDLDPITDPPIPLNPLRVPTPTRIPTPADLAPSLSLLQETTFTLLELRDMLQRSRLKLVGVFFASSTGDLRARTAYRQAEGGRWQAEDPEQLDLRNWHALERAQPCLFGRMHVLHCQAARVE